MKIQNTQNPRDSKVAYSLPKSNNKARSKATKSGSDTGPVTLTLDPTRPDQNRWPGDPKIRFHHCPRPLAAPTKNPTPALGLQSFGLEPPVINPGHAHGQKYVISWFCVPLRNFLTGTLLLSTFFIHKKRCKNAKNVKNAFLLENKR